MRRYVEHLQQHRMQDMRKNTNGKIQSFEGLRLFFVMTIALSHCAFFRNPTAAYIQKNFLTNARIGVYFFFLLSGFGLTYSIRTGKASVPDTGLKSCIEFGRQHVKKIFSCYLLSLVLCIPVTIFNDITNHGVRTGVILLLVRAINLPFLTQSLFGFAGLSHAFNGVCWFLSTTFLLYIFFPKLYAFAEAHVFGLSIKRKWGVCIATVGADSLLFLLFREIETFAPFDDLAYGSPYFRVVSFFLGMLLCDIFLEERERKKFSDGAEVVTLAGTLAWLLFRNSSFLISFDSIFPASVLKEIADLLVAAANIYVFSFESGCISRFFAKPLMTKWGGRLSISTSFTASLPAL